jgi:sugar lactone lactonase YvrE
MRLPKQWRVYLLSPAIMTVALALVITTSSIAMAAGGSFIAGFNKISQIASTVPTNGDQNPYGMVVVPKSVGKLVRGDILISNFNNNGANGGLQGTGTTIVQISPQGKVSTFAQINASKLPGACPGGVGLTTALTVLQRGWVIVGSLPTSDGSSATAKAGCLIVLDSKGHAVETFSGGTINGPWDMTALDLNSKAVLFVTNVLNGTVAASPNTVNKGTVVRINLSVPEQGYGLPYRQLTTTIGSGFAERTDPAALVIGPTGVGLESNGTLYVADSANSRIAAIPDALTRYTTAGSGKTVSSGGLLNDPLGLTIAPNGNILTTNGNDGNIVETTPSGHQIAHKSVDTTGGTGAGCLFGLTTVYGFSGVYFVDDCTNTLDLLH